MGGRGSSSRAGEGSPIEGALQGGKGGSSRGCTAGGSHCRGLALQGAPVEGALQGGRRVSSRGCTAGREEGLQ